MAQVVNGRSITKEARFQSQAKPWLIYDEKVTLRVGFQRVYSVTPPALHSHSPIHLSPLCIISAIDSVFKQNTK